MQIDLLRHAKAVEARARDFERPLDPRGVRAASVMGVYLAQRGRLPELVLCSAARRTRETWEYVAAAWPEPPTAALDPELYLASAEQLLLRLRGLDDAVRRVLVIGHNPGIEDLALGLIGTGDRRSLSRMREKFPTAALATLEADLEKWSQLGSGDASLGAFLLPRDLV